MNVFKEGVNRTIFKQSVYIHVSYINAVKGEREREIGTGEWEHGTAYHASMEPRQEICHSGELKPRIQTPWNGSRPSWNGGQGMHDI